MWSSHPNGRQSGRFLLHVIGSLLLGCVACLCPLNVQDRARPAFEASLALKEKTIYPVSVPLGVAAETELTYSPPSPHCFERLPGELGLLPDLEHVYAENNWLSTLPKELATCRFASKEGPHTFRS